MFPLALLALAQPPDAPPPAPSATAVLTGEAVERPPLPAVDVGKVDLVFGLPLSVRYQHPLSARLWAEVGGGLWVIVPEVFAGARLDLGLARGRRDCVAVRPGGGARLVVWPGSSGWFGSRAAATVGVYGDVDLVWQRAWSDGLCTECGLKLGAMPFVNGRGGGVLPIAGLILGVRF